MRKFRGIALALALVLTLPLTACGNRPGTDAGGQPQQSSATAPSVDITDLEGLAETYLYPIVFSGVTQDTWDRASSIDPHRLVTMVGYMKVWNADIPEEEMEFKDGVPYYYLDETILEDYVQAYFDVSTDHLRTADQYSAEKHAYAFNMSGVGFAYDPQVLAAEYDEALRQLTLHLDDGYGGSEKPGEAAALTIQLREEGFQYVSSQAVADNG